VARGLETRFTFDPGNDGNPTWTPDGSAVIFSSLRKGKKRLNIYRKSVAGSGQDELLLETERDKLPTQVTPDGKSLIYHTRGDPVTRTDIWMMPLQGGGEPEALLKSEFNETYGTVSPDGRFMAYESDESGRTEIYACTFPTPTRKWQISTAGGEKPHWRGDGREIVYLAADAHLTAVAVTPTAADLQVGGSTSLFIVRPQRPGNVYEMTSDGQRFLVNSTVVDANAQPLTLVVPWTAEIATR
jgi:eukaryotic-like serine/threonine-protein kinase